MLWSDLMVNACSALFGAVIGAAATVYFHRRAERTKEKDAIRFRIYMKLLDCQNPLFWMCRPPISRTDSEHEQLRKAQYERRFEEKRWKVADELRTIDDLPQMERILRVLFSENYKSAMHRYEELGRVIDDLGDACNPHFRDVMGKIGDENLRLVANDFKTGRAELEGKAEEALKKRLKQANGAGSDGV